MTMEKCCCCIPLRGGVFIIALLLLLGNAAEVAALFLRRDQVVQYFGVYNNQISIVFWVAVALSSLYALASLFGVIGAGFANRSMILIFATINWCFVIVSFILSAATWLYILIKKDDITTACASALNGTTTAVTNSTVGGSTIYKPLFGPSANGTTTGSEDAYSVCANALKWMAIWLGVTVIIGNMFSVYFAAAVSAYANRLKRFNNHTKLQDMDEVGYAPNKSLAGTYNTPY